MIVTPANDAPYQRIAAELRQRIASGAIEVGEQLPSEKALAVELGVATNTVSKAMAELRREGLVETGGRRRAKVLRSPVIRYRAADYYRRPQPGENSSPSARDAERVGKTLQPDHDTTQVLAPADIALRLGVEPGDRVMRTVYTFLVDGHPLLGSTSWEPYDLVGGTDIEWPEPPESRQPGTAGVIARFDLIGWHINRVDERFSSRQPSVDERDKLAIPEGVTVTTIAREQYATGPEGDVRVVEVCDMVIPADRYTVVIRHQVPADSA